MMMLLMVVLVLLMMMFEVLPLCRRGRVGKVVWKRRFGGKCIDKKQERQKHYNLFSPPLVESLRLLWG